jgi:hypothetical protein
MTDVTYCPPNVTCPVYVRMSAEIERLRAENDQHRIDLEEYRLDVERLRAEVKTWINHTKSAVWSDSEECKLLTAEVEKLRAALDEAAFDMRMSVWRGSDE